MKKTRPVLFALTRMVALAALAVAGPALAEFKAVQSPAAILYDAPSKQAKKLFVAPRGMPVEVLSVLPAWIKIRDHSGDVMWVERAELGPVKSLLTTAVAGVHQTAAESSPLLFQIERGVLVEIAEMPSPANNGWVKVKAADGSWGFVKTSDVYGL